MPKKDTQDKCLNRLDLLLFFSTHILIHITLLSKIDILLNLSTSYFFENLIDYSFDILATYFIFCCIIYFIISFLLSEIVYGIASYILTKFFIKPIHFILKFKIISFSALFLQICIHIYSIIIVGTLFTLILNDTINFKIYEKTKTYKLALNIFNNIDNSDLVIALKKSNILYNGTPLHIALKSSDEIRELSFGITKDLQTSYEKALAIHNWIGQNIQYDNELSEKVLTNTANGEYGAIYAFNTKSGICFDFASLFTVMAKEIKLPVRFISGQAFDGKEYGPHAWNQVFIQEENRWINIDSTFWGFNDSFDTEQFNDTHIPEDILGEWTYEQTNINT